jgi:hypothetical protein
LRAFGAQLSVAGALGRKTANHFCWRARALGQKACREDISVLYHRMPRLFGALALARGDGRYAKLLQTLGRVRLLILDDWGPAMLQHRLFFS